MNARLSDRLSARDSRLRRLGVAEVSLAKTQHGTTTLLSGFDTITYGRLRDRVTALASAWQSSLPGGFHPGDFVAVLGFTSTGYAMINLACIRLGAVFVPLQTSSTAGQLAPIVAETEPRIFAASIESLDIAVEVFGASSVERLVVFDYLSDDDEQRERYQSATARLAAAGRSPHRGDSRAAPTTAAY